MTALQCPAAREGFRLLSLLMAWTFLGVIARSAEPTLVKVVQDKKVILGEVLSEKDGEVEILNLKTGKHETFPKLKLGASPPKPVPDKEAVMAVGLPKFLAWKIDKLVPAKAVSGKVAEVEEEAIVVSLGSQHGIALADRLGVYRGSRKVKDPVTGEVLGTRRKKVTVLEIVEVQPRISTAKQVGETDVTLEVGDVVEPLSSKRAVAVLPFPGDDDTAGSYSDKLATDLLNAGIPIVERKVLDEVMVELKLQQGEEFDKKQAQKLGAQLGASALVVGKIVPKAQGSEAQIRLIRVDSGEVLLATSEKLDRKASGIERAKPPATASSGKGKGKKYAFTKVFAFVNEKDIKGAWVLPGENEYQLRNPGLYLHTDGTTRIKSKYEFKGDMELAIDCIVGDDRGTHLHMFGEHLVKAGVGHHVIVVVKKGAAVDIGLDGDKIVQVTVKDSMLESAHPFEILLIGSSTILGISVKADSGDIAEAYK